MNNKAPDYNKQPEELQELADLRNGYIDIRKKYISKRDRYHAFLTLLNKNGYSKSFLAEYVSDVSGQKVTVQYIGKLINQINRKRGDTS